MANLYITEFGGITTHAQAARMPPLNQQKVAFTTSAQSAELKSATVLVRLTADADAHIKIGTDPTADATDMLLPSGVVEYFAVPYNGDLKIAAYDGTS